jgi:hypothetical protein
LAIRLQLAKNEHDESAGSSKARENFAIFASARRAAATYRRPKDRSSRLSDLPIFWRSSGVIDLYGRIRRHHRDRNDLVVACSDQQVLKLDRRERRMP